MRLNYLFKMLMIEKVHFILTINQNSNLNNKNLIKPLKVQYKLDHYQHKQEDHLMLI